MADTNELSLTAEELDAKYNPEGGGEHPDYRRADWRAEVASDNTLLGYWHWVEAQIWEHQWDEEE